MFVHAFTHLRASGRSGLGWLGWLRCCGLRRSLLGWNGLFWLSGLRWLCYFGFFFVTALGVEHFVNGVEGGLAKVAYHLLLRLLTSARMMPITS